MRCAYAWAQNEGASSIDGSSAMKKLNEDYEVLFSGEVYRGADRVVVKRNLALLFNEDPAKIEQLFTGRTVVLKNGLNRKTAERYQVALAKAGAVSKIRNRAEPLDAKARFNVDESREFTLRDISVHRVVCPRCNYQQLEAELCVRCGANIDEAAREKVKQDRVKARRKRPVIRPKSISVRPRRVVVERERDAYYNAQEDVVYVGFGPRFVAFLVDSAVVAVLLGVIVAGLSFALLPEGLSAENLLRLISGDAQVSEISWTMNLFPTVFFLLFWFAISSTPGKLAVRGVIRDERTLGEPEWWQFLVRYLGYFPSTICLGLGFFWIIWDEKHQGWHDKLARTVVVETE
jgi:uncharacterized RDD family membrane protein YckC